MSVVRVRPQRYTRPPSLRGVYVSVSLVTLSNLPLSFSWFICENMDIASVEKPTIGAAQPPQSQPASPTQVETVPRPFQGQDHVANGSKGGLSAARSRSAVDGKFPLERLRHVRAQLRQLDKLMEQTASIE